MVWAEDSPKDGEFRSKFTGFRPAVQLIDICKEEVQTQEHFRENQNANSN